MIEDKKEKFRDMKLLLELIQLVEIWESLPIAKVTNPKHNNYFLVLRVWRLKPHSMQTKSSSELYFLWRSYFLGHYNKNI